MNDTDTYEGTVFSKTTGHYYVHSNGQTITCTVSAKLRKELILPTASRASVKKQRVQAVNEVPVVDPVAVGDKVVFIEAGTPDTGHIIEVLPRSGYITRQAPGTKIREQIIATNVDQILVVTAAWQPKPNWGMIDRYLAGAEACETPAILVITKLDLIWGTKREAPLMKIVEAYRQMGYTVLLTSSQQGKGISEVKDLLQDKTSVLIGMSGVGKSSLLNAVQPDLGIKVNQINTKIDKGRHITVHLEMFELDFGGAIIDTPGMKLFGLWDVEPEDLDMLFREMRPLVGQCKFGLSCTHTHEPDCAIKSAVEAGTISERRYDSYTRIFAYITPDY